jgi:tetratricopeptide (TPR) repeat protein
MSMDAFLSIATQFTGPDGKIDYGKVVRFHRKRVRGWKDAGVLADLYNEIFEEDVSIRWVQRMEQHNKVPENPTRRWVLATLLNIPPALLGLPFLANPDPQELQIITSVKLEPVDTVEYWATLGHFWKNYYTRRPSDVIEQVASRIYNLQEVLLYGEKQRSKEIATLLCNYHILLANICRDQRSYNTAIVYLNKAVKLARERALHELHATALYLRGYTFRDLWETSPRKDDRTDLYHALDDLNAALRMKQEQATLQPLNQPLQASILFDLGEVLAHTAQDEQDRRKPLQAVDQAGNIVRASGFSCGDYFLRVDEEYYYMVKARADIALGRPVSASREVANIKGNYPHLQRRYVGVNIIEARASIARGRFPIAISHLEDALAGTVKVKSGSDLARIVNLYEELKGTSYANDPELARLGVQLFKVQHPEIFDGYYG